MNKDKRNEEFAKCLKSFPKKYGRLSFRDHIILRVAFDFGIDAAIEHCNLPELKKEIAELKAAIDTAIPLLEKSKERSYSLVKADHIIKKLLWDLRNKNYDSIKDIEEAEKFLGRDNV